MEVSDNHFFALTEEGDLYGWGIVGLLGCGELRDLREQLIYDVVNPV